MGCRGYELPANWRLWGKLRSYSTLCWERRKILVPASALPGNDHCLVDHSLNKPVCLSINIIAFLKYQQQIKETNNQFTTYVCRNTHIYAWGQLWKDVYQTSILKAAEGGLYVMVSLYIYIKLKLYFLGESKCIEKLFLYPYNSYFFSVPIF